jgi:DNA-binding response OmpR family regulator
MRSYIREHLIQNYRVLEAAHGKEGLDIANREIPDLIITDIMMPEMDGITFCSTVRRDERTSHIPVVVLTAKEGRDNKIEGLETGADDYLTKPFDARELMARIKNLIHQRQQLRKKFSHQITLQPKDISITSVDGLFLEKVESTIEKCLSDYDFGVPQLQDALAMSKTQLHRKMKALTDQAPGEFLRNYRLKRAAQLLAKQGGNITEIAFAVGFGSLSYFTRSFKDLFGKSPSEYSQSQKEANRL